MNYLSILDDFCNLDLNSTTWELDVHRLFVDARCRMYLGFTFMQKSFLSKRNFKTLVFVNRFGIKSFDISKKKKKRMSYVKQNMKYGNRKHSEEKINLDIKKK